MRRRHQSKNNVPTFKSAVLSSVSQLWFTAALAFLTSLPAHPVLAKPTPDFWAFPSPRQLPFDEHLVAEKKEAGILTRSFYFTSEVDKGERYRIYAVYAAPVSKQKVPAILNIHGAGGTADPDATLEWARRGYACLSFDWWGDPQGENAHRINYSRFGSSTHRPGADESYDRAVQFTATPRESRTYHALIAARRALSWLSARPEVDARKLGVIGVSWGSFYSLLLASIDSRVKASVIVYGAGFFQSTDIGGGAFGLTGPLIYSAPEAQRSWLQSFDPEHYLARSKAPCFMMTGTNDAFFWLPLQQRTYAALPGEKRLWLAPNVNHSVHTELKSQMDTSAGRWFDFYLRGQGKALPQISEISLDGREASFEISPDIQTKDITDIKLNYLLTPYDPGGENMSVYAGAATIWQAVTAERDEATGCWRALLPMPAAENQWISIFASVRTADGVILSSSLKVLPFSKQD